MSIFLHIIDSIQYNGKFYMQTLLFISVTFQHLCCSDRLIIWSLNTTPTTATTYAILLPSVYFFLYLIFLCYPLVLCPMDVVAIVIAVGSLAASKKNVSHSLQMMWQIEESIPKQIYVKWLHWCWRQHDGFLCWKISHMINTFAWFYGSHNNKHA